MDNGNKVSLRDHNVIHRSKNQIILFNAHMNKANGARRTCKSPSNWPVWIPKLCQTAVRKGASKSGGTQRFAGLVSAATQRTFH